MQVVKSSTGEPQNVTDLLRDKTILIAEDEEVNIEYFKALFSILPIKTIFVTNGKMAIEKVNSGEKIDIILMDIRMPIMNGMDAAKEIFKKHPKTKIIAQTAYAMSNDKAKFLNSGFIDYIPKPLDKEELIKKLVTHLKK